MAWRERYLDWLAAALLVAGFALRWRLAGWTYFELDEAYHVRLSAPGFPQLWRTMHEPTHPPLLIFLLHWIRTLGSSEYVFRAIPAICGTLFPWFVYRWLTLAWSRGAGFAALVILTFSPTLVHLSAVVRGYTLALFWMSVALWCLEKAMAPATASSTEPSGRSGRRRAWMAGFGLSLWLAALSEFPVAFFCAGAGVYALLSWRRLDRNSRIVWAGGQLLCAATYVHLYFKQVKPLRASHQGLVNDPGGYFAEQFPRAGETIAGFAWKGTFGQFQLLMQWEAGAWLLAALFGLGVLVILQRRRWAFAALVLLPFAAACAAAFAKTHPYGNSRQTIVLGLLAAAAAGIALDWTLRRRAMPVAAVLLALVPVWYTRGAMNPATWSPAERRSVMAEVIRYLRDHAPEGSRILSEGHTLMLLSHYLDPEGRLWPGSWDRGEGSIAGYRMKGLTGMWQGWEQVWTVLNEWRESHQIDPAETVWIVDMAFSCPLCEEEGLRKNLGIHREKAVRWNGVAVIAPVPAGYRGPEESP